MPRNKEHRQPSPEGFDFTENEKLFSRVSDARFRELVFNPHTPIHTARIASNNYGEFVFVTASRPNGRKTETGAEVKEVYTFWSLGMHEPRDRWLVGEWFYHRANQLPATMKLKTTQAKVEELLHERQSEVAPYAEKHKQSQYGQMFEDLAELTDDDGAMSEIEDLDGLFGALFGDLE
jgi:hypothetical protein